MKIFNILSEAKKEKEKKIVFKETDGRSEFPPNTITAIKKKIGVMARDLDADWKNSAELVNSAMEELEVPKPPAFLKARWEQYVTLISEAEKQLYQARGRTR